MKSDVQLNLRAKESQRALIDAAAEILHKSRTDFILEMACQAAENVILDRRVFNFNDEQYAEFINMLDAPVADDPAIENCWQGNRSGTCNSTRALIQRPSTGGVRQWRGRA